jgi:hypothetical protein
MESGGVTVLLVLSDRGDEAEVAIAPEVADVDAITTDFAFDPSPWGF